MKPRPLRAAALLAAACVLSLPTLAAPPQGHHRHDAGAGGDAAGPGPAPGPLMRTLEDEQRTTTGGRVAWSTFWKLCWAPVAGARHYEVRLVTSEGAPRTPQAWSATCYRVEVAAGENAADQGMPHRALMLAMQAAQAALQVRVVFADGRRGAWTAEQPVGGLQAPPEAPR